VWLRYELFRGTFRQDAFEASERYLADFMNAPLGQTVGSARTLTCSTKAPQAVQLVLFLGFRSVEGSSTQCVRPRKPTQFAKRVSNAPSRRRFSLL
jgi:hypothetical protein